MAVRFKNLDGSGPHPLGNILKWAVGDKLAGRRRKSPPGAPVPRVEPDLAALATPPAPGEGARLTWLGHASWLVQLDGVSLLIDPALRPSITGFIRRNVDPGMALEQLPPIAATLVSHNHYDHLDMPTVRRVGAPVMTGLGMARYFNGALPLTELDWWGSTRVGPVTVHFVPAQHWSRRGLKDVNETLWGGFVVQGSSASVYHSGDTAYFQEGFREIGQRFPGL
ncbi:MAG TPA: MBL fold metallo-hydrolase, partial [Myxococcaceae bacterium]|nr:MBL fold metallo-hydrolase [Myxococcaceae bacterium]